MNELIRAICRKEGIEAKIAQPLSGGQINQVFLVDDTYIVRVGSGKDALQRLGHETELLHDLADEIPVPRVYAFGQWEDSVYQVQQFIQGRRLHHVWNSLSPGKQGRIMADLTRHLKVLHGRTFAEFGYPHNGQHHTSWPELCESRFRAAVKEIRAWRSHIPPTILEMAIHYFDTRKHTLQDGMPVLVHGDLWPGNILVDDDGEVVAILDEFSAQAPKDYEILMLEEFCLYPNDYAEEDNEIYSTADFVGWFSLCRRHYPELFDVRHLRERLNLYHLEHTLSSYVACSKGHGDAFEADVLIHTVARMTNFVFDHGTRMFLC